jgi:hypothetical protein
MPKIDPTTGCVVRTQQEFWQAEADAEDAGRSGADLAAEFYDEMEAECGREAESMRDPAEALRAIKACDDQEEPAHRVGGGVIAVRRVLRADYKQSLRSCECMIVAEVECADGRARFVRWGSASWYGTMLDPPDYDESLDEITEEEATSNAEEAPCPTT